MVTLSNSHDIYKTYKCYPSIYMVKHNIFRYHELKKTTTIEVRFDIPMFLRDRAINYKD